MRVSQVINLSDIARDETSTQHIALLTSVVGLPVDKISVRHMYTFLFVQRREDQLVIQAGGARLLTT